MNMQSLHSSLHAAPRIFLGVVISVCSILFSLAGLAFAIATGFDPIGW